MSYNNRYAPSDVPIPTTRPPTGGSNVRRAKTLTRPERGVAQAPLITPPATLLPSPSGKVSAVPAHPEDSWDTWRIFSKVVTFWAPSMLLKSIGGLKDGGKQQAWREKIALCVIALLLGAIVGFATVGLQKVLCPDNVLDDINRFSRKGTTPSSVGIQGFLFRVSASSPTTNGTSVPQLSSSDPGGDITPLFQRDVNSYPACKGLNFRVAQDPPCNTQTSCSLPTISQTSLQTLGLTNSSLFVGYDWDQVAAKTNYLVIDGTVLNMDPYMSLHPSAVPGDDVDTALRTLLRTQSGASGKDGTRLFYGRSSLRSAVPCLLERYHAGNIDKVTPGCFVSQLVLYAGLIVILAIVLVRFAMACIFNWFMSSRLAGPIDNMNLSRSAISPAVLPEGANVAIDNKHGTAPWAGHAAAKRTNKLTSNKSMKSLASTSSTTLVGSDSGISPTITLAQIGAELFTVCLVTCYSEGEESLRTTLDSISLTTYSDSRKLLFVVADGMITGAGEKRSTPDTCVSLLESDPRFGDPMPMSYIAVGSGSKKENRAMVYAGHYCTFYLSVIILLFESLPFLNW